MGKHLSIILAIVAIAVVGYGIMRGLFYILPVSDVHATGMRIFLTLGIIGLGLSIPYWMLKLGIHKAKLSDPNEQEISLENIPKDHNEVTHTVKPSIR